MPSPIEIEVRARVQRLERDLRRANRQIDRFSRRGQRSSQALAASFRRVGVALAAAFSVGAVTRGIQNQIRQLAQYQTQALAASSSIREFAVATQLASEAGLQGGAERLASAIGRMGINLRRYRDDLDSWGVNTAQLIELFNRDAGAAFSTLIDQVSQYGNTLDRTRILTKIFEQDTGIALTVLSEIRGEYESSRQELLRYTQGVEDFQASLRVLNQTRRIGFAFTQGFGQGFSSLDLRRSEANILTASDQMFEAGQVFGEAVASFVPVATALAKGFTFIANLRNLGGLLGPDENRLRGPTIVERSLERRGLPSGRPLFSPSLERELRSIFIPESAQFQAGGRQTAEVAAAAAAAVTQLSTRLRPVPHPGQDAVAQFERDRFSRLLREQEAERARRLGSVRATASQAGVIADALPDRAEFNQIAENFAQGFSIAFDQVIRDRDFDNLGESILQAIQGGLINTLSQVGSEFFRGFADGLIGGIFDGLNDAAGNLGRAAGGGLRSFIGGIFGGIPGRQRGGIIGPGGRDTELRYLSPGEVVLPEGVMPAGGTNVVVNNYAGVGVGVREQTGDDGIRQTVIDVTAADILQGGELDQAQRLRQSVASGISYG